LFSGKTLKAILGKSYLTIVSANWSSNNGFSLINLFSASCLTPINLEDKASISALVSFTAERYSPLASSIPVVPVPAGFKPYVKTFENPLIKD